ncbi:hypothetical protein GGH92_009880, partial [Coemansia sp. RSA 2673]
MSQPNIAALADHDLTNALYRSNSADEGSTDGSTDHAYTTAKPPPSVSLRHVRLRSRASTKSSTADASSPQRLSPE